MAQDLQSSDFAEFFASNPGHQPTGSSVLEPDSVFDEHGRSYHAYKEGKYFLPNDGAEQDRLDFQHAGIRLLLGGKLAHAPISNPKNVIDVATGTGIWALQYAQENPSSHVIGTDLSKIQPEVEAAFERNANCEFIKDDAEEEWLYGHKFDYVHLRFVVSCFNDHRTVMKHAFDNLNPGGWVEYQDSTAKFYRFNGSTEGTAVDKWSKLLFAGAASIGRDMSVPERYQEWLREVGFVDVQQKLIPWPISPWPEDATLKKAGRFNQMTWLTGNLATTRRLVGMSGEKPEVIDQLVEDAKREIMDEENKLFIPFWIVYGRKPTEGETQGSKEGQEGAGSEKKTG